MRSRSSRGLTVLTGLAFFALAGCESIGDPIAVLRGDIPPPDEFQVVAYEPLVMPPSLEVLPPPRPGVPSPREPDAEALAVSALAGAGGSPVQEGAEPSAGERVLLRTAKAAGASSDIRYQLEEDAKAPEKARDYEPPSLGELLGLSKKPKVPKGDVLEPSTEAERLVSEGAPAPLDPEAAARRTEEEQRSSEPLVKPDYPTGRPESPIVGKKSVPAY